VTNKWLLLKLNLFDFNVNILDRFGSHLYNSSGRDNSFTAHILGRLRAVYLNVYIYYFCF
jgi:hypothetical protein